MVQVPGRMLVEELSHLCSDELPRLPTFPSPAPCPTVRAVKRYHVVCPPQLNSLGPVSKAVHKSPEARLKGRRTVSGERLSRKRKWTWYHARIVSTQGQLRGPPIWPDLEPRQRTRARRPTPPCTPSHSRSAHAQCSPTAMLVTHAPLALSHDRCVTCAKPAGLRVADAHATLLAVNG